MKEYQDFVSDRKDFFGNDCDWDSLALLEGFRGFLKLGQEIEV